MFSPAKAAFSRGNHGPGSFLYIVKQELATLYWVDVDFEQYFAVRFILELPFDLRQSHQHATGVKQIEKVGSFDDFF